MYFQYIKKNISKYNTHLNAIPPREIILYFINLFRKGKNNNLQYSIFNLIYLYFLIIYKLTRASQSDLIPVIF